MADTVEASPVVAPEQESRSFELPAEEPPPAAAAVEDATPSSPAEDDAGSSSSEKKADPLFPGASELPAEVGGKWAQLLNTIRPVVRRHADTVANHPYVAGTASTLRQRAGQAQERVQPLVNHPYVQKGTGAIKAGGAKTIQASTDKRFLLITVGLVGLGLLIRVLLQKYPEFGGDLKMKFMQKKEEL